jgi:hypothetical protein
MVKIIWREEDKNCRMVFEYCVIRGLIYYTTS